ncbi:hypothetical protein GCM10022255_099820 [Dactylosporangium darangshiense]|uniref:Uncharacterized protein n=1 Tax=Dactylosporangium darangshiense TaxID=579108 RepID=A0ABP8DRP1_9ACTN
MAEHDGGVQVQDQTRDRLAGRRALRSARASLRYLCPGQFRARARASRSRANASSSTLDKTRFTLELPCGGMDKTLDKSYLPGPEGAFVFPAATVRPPWRKREASS